MKSFLPKIKISLIIFSAFSLLSFCMMPFAHSVSAQETDFRVLVNGKPFTGMFAAPQKRGQRLFLPALPIANLLGDQMDIESGGQTVRVRRQTGVTAEYDSSTRQVKENGTVTLSLANAESIVIPPYEEFLLLPTEIIITLFGVSVQVDSAKREINIRRGAGSERQITTTAKKEKAIQIHQADYDYRLDKYDSSVNQNLTLNLRGFVGDNKFSLLLNNSSGKRHTQFWQPRSGVLTVTRPNSQEFTAGNTLSSQNLLFIQTPMQGGKFSTPAFGGRLGFFGGKTSSDWHYLDINPLAQPKRADSIVLGGTFNFNDSNLPKSSASLEKSAGVLYFRRNQNNDGLVVSGNASYSTGKATVRTDAAAGSFSDLSHRTENREFGFAAGFSGNIRLTDNFVLQGHLIQVSRHFRSPRSYQNYPQNTFGGGFSWRPLSWMSTAFSGSFSKRIDREEFQTRSFSATVNISPRDRRLPTVYFSHLQLGNSQFRSGAITNLNITKELSRWQIFSNFTRIKTVGAAAANFQFGARTGSIGNGFLQITQTFGSRGLYAGGFDWRTGEIFTKRLGFSAGIGYLRNSNGNFALTQRASTMLQLPRRTTLQFDFLKNPNGFQFGISLRGSFFNPRESGGYYFDSNSKPEKLSSIFGRVYQDVNENGVFDPEIDTPQEEIRLRLGTGQTVSTDSGGFFRFNNIPGGEYRIILDPLTIRADLTILDGQETELSLLPSQNAIVDFRLVRTGQVTGTVWLDSNGNGTQDEGEPALADVRVIAGNGHDTLTDSAGTFIIGDLSPGEYVLFIDEKTLPVNTKSSSETVNIKVTAGKRVGEILLPVIPKPAITKSF